MSRLLLALAFVAVGIIGGFADAEAQAFVTAVRVDCRADTSGGAGVHVYRDGELLTSAAVPCTDGSFATADLLTVDEPNAWAVSNITAGNILCIGEAGTRFPALFECGGGSTAVSVMVFRPRRTN